MLCCVWGGGGGGGAKVWGDLSCSKKVLKGTWGPVSFFCVCENTRQVQSVPLAEESSCCRGLFRLGERSEMEKKARSGWIQGIQLDIIES